MTQPKLKNILIVDDEIPNQRLLESMVESLGHNTQIAGDGPEALAMLQPDIDLVLLDVMMPGMDGFEVTKRIREQTEYSDLPIIIVTALSSREDQLRAVKAGANDFIGKPVHLAELEVRTTSLLKMKEAQDAVKSYQAELESMVVQRTEALRKALQDSRGAERRAQQAQLDTIRCLALAAEHKGEDTANHIERMSLYSTLLAQCLELPDDEIELIRVASPMHDVGKIGIPDAILLKDTSLTADEWEVMKQHTTIGARILDAPSSELLQSGKVIALNHHEMWDGNGYPNGLAGEDIPLWGRICAVADVFDALSTNRPYRAAFSNEKALAIVKEKRGTHLDPRLVDLFFQHFDQVLAIQNTFIDPESDS